MEEDFLRALQEQPDNQCLRLVFSDWLEERGDLRGELLRLLHTLTQTCNGHDRRAGESRLRNLLAAGVQPVGPRWTNSLGMAFAWIPAGTFLMGSPLHEPERQHNETPHQVTLTRGFYLGVHPVTQAQWQTVLGENPSRFPHPDQPVEGISWLDCQEFCAALAKKDGLGTGLPSPYRLPTEAEWEYACRAGTTTAFHCGDTLAPQQANYHANGATGKRRQQTSPVGQFPANAWGLTDMHGNVFEWCADGYLPYPEGPAVDPLGKHAELRVLRGGSWHSLAARCRSACRAWGAPDYGGSDVGCRVCFRVDYHFSI